MRPTNKRHCGVGILVVYTTLILVIALTNSHQTQVINSQEGTEAIVASDSLNTIQPDTTANTSPTAASTTSIITPSTITTTTTTTTPKPKNLTCPSKCSCTSTKVNCEGKQLTQVPKFELKNCPFTEFRFANNSLTFIDFKQFPMATIEILDLSDNNIQSPHAKKKPIELTKLKVLDVSKNKLESLSTLFNPASKMPALETLNLADNPIDKLNASDFSTMPSLKSVDLSRMTLLSAIDENSFASLTKLQFLNLSKSVENVHLLDQLFAKNLVLETLDLSYNYLVEVPAALRSTPSIKHLYLDGNSMISLRQSDFINRKRLKSLQMRYCDQLLRVEPGTFAETTSLKTLIISNNKRFIDFSVDSFKTIRNDSSAKSSSTERTLEMLDLSANNLTTMPNPFETFALKFMNLRLVDNPWDCTCSIEWMVKQPSLLGSQPIHCASPAKFKDMELSQYFHMVDCQVEASAMQKFVLVMFLLFIIVLTVAVFAQRADICQRLQWRDQYGTIYYTKASFPTEQV